MKETRIPFSDDMVLALLSGAKTQTRRIVRSPSRKHPEFVLVEYPPGILQPYYSDDGESHITDDGMEESILCPYGVPGDILLGTEAWRHTALNLEDARSLTEDIMSGTAIDYRADYVEGMMRDGPMSCEEAEECRNSERWKSSRFMPKWASRLRLQITDVRVERLQDISEGDAIAEGCTNSLNLEGGRFANENFAHLWWRIYGDGSWEKNPYVWAISFRRLP